jgi:hypothetical protein
LFSPDGPNRVYSCGIHDRIRGKYPERAGMGAEIASLAPFAIDIDPSSFHAYLLLLHGSSFQYYILNYFVNLTY